MTCTGIQCIESEPDKRQRERVRERLDENEIHTRAATVQRDFTTIREHKLIIKRMKSAQTSNSLYFVLLLFSAFEFVRLFSLSSSIFSVFSVICVHS